MEEDIKWLCRMARSSCDMSITNEREIEKRARIDKIESMLLKKEEEDKCHQEQQE